MGARGGEQVYPEFLIARRPRTGRGRVDRARLAQVDLLGCTRGSISTAAARLLCGLSRKHGDDA